MLATITDYAICPWLDWGRLGNFAVLNEGPNIMAMNKKQELVASQHPLYVEFGALLEKHVPELAGDREAGLHVLALMERKLRVEKKPFSEAMLEAVADKYETATVLAKLKISKPEAKLLMMSMPKPALLIMATELGIKGLSSAKADDIRESILAGKNIKAKPADELPLMKAAKAA